MPKYHVDIVVIGHVTYEKSTCNGSLILNRCGISDVINDKFNEESQGVQFEENNQGMMSLFKGMEEERKEDNGMAVNVMAQ